MSRLLVALWLLPFSCFGKIPVIVDLGGLPRHAVFQSNLLLLGVGGPESSGTTATPGLVSFSGKNSTLTVALGTAGGAGQLPTTLCPTSLSWTYCMPFAESALSGNLGVSVCQYANGGTGITTTRTDDKSNAWTVIGNSAADSNKLLTLGYTPNLASGTSYVSATFGTTAVTQVTCQLAMFDNIATSSPLRTSGTQVGTSSTTMTGPTVTTSANDLVFAYFARTGTPLMTSGSFNVGSGFTPGLFQYQDGIASEWQVSAGGNVTPTMTMGSASTYIVFVAVFEASTGSAGTAPSAPYLQRISSWSSPPPPYTASPEFQFPNSAGSLLVMKGGGAVNYAINSITDSGSNTWSLLGQCLSTGSCQQSGGYSYEFASRNAGANVTATQTLNASGSGDTTVFFEEYVGMPAASFTNRFQTGSNANTTGSLPAAAVSFLPWATSPLTDAVGIVAFNTGTTVLSPAGATNHADEGFFGGQTIDGGASPQSIIDQNQIWTHSYQTGIVAAQNWQWNAAVTEASETNNVGIDLLSFLTNSGIGIVNTTSTQGTSGSTLAITVPATTANNALVVATGFYDGATVRTVSKVCTDGATCAANHTFTQLTGAAAANVANTLLGTDIWYCTNCTAGATTITITYSGAITTADAAYWEIAKGAATTWAADGNGAHVSNGASCSTTCTGASVTPTGTQDFCLAIIETSGTGVTVNPKTGNAAWTAGYAPQPTASVAFTSGGAATALLTNASTARTPTWTTAAGTFNESTGCFK